MILTLLFVSLLLVGAIDASANTIVQTQNENSTLTAVTMEVRRATKEAKYVSVNMISPQTAKPLSPKGPTEKIAPRFAKLTFADCAGSVDIFVDNDSIGGMVHIVVDQNSNGIADDTCHHFFSATDIPTSFEDMMDNYMFTKYPSIKVSTPTDTTSVILYPFYGTNHDKIEMITQLYVAGSLTIDGQAITIHGAVPTLYYDERRVESFSFFDQNQETYPKSYMIGDTVQLGASQLKLEK